MGILKELHYNDLCTFYHSSLARVTGIKVATNMFLRMEDDGSIFMYYCMVRVLEMNRDNSITCIASIKELQGISHLLIPVFRNKFNITLERVTPFHFRMQGSVYFPGLRMTSATFAPLNGVAKRPINREKLTEWNRKFTQGKQVLLSAVQLGLVDDLFGHHTKGRAFEAHKFLAFLEDRSKAVSVLENLFCVAMWRGARPVMWMRDDIPARKAAFLKFISTELQSQSESLRVAFGVYEEIHE